MFHSSIPWSDQSILLIFGRSNPSKLFDNVVKLKIGNEISVEIVELTLDPSLNQTGFNYGRFRHGSCQTQDFKLVVYGGKRFETESFSQVLNDAFIVDKNFLVKELSVN